MCGIRIHQPHTVVLFIKPIAGDAHLFVYPSDRIVPSGMFYIHFRRFQTGRRQSPRSRFPRRILCTHTSYGLHFHVLSKRIRQSQPQPLPAAMERSVRIIASRVRRRRRFFRQPHIRLVFPGKRFAANIVFPPKREMPRRGRGKSIPGNKRLRFPGPLPPRLSTVSKRRRYIRQFHMHPQAVRTFLIGPFIIVMIKEIINAQVYGSILVDLFFYQHIPKAERLFFIFRRLLNIIAVLIFFIGILHIAGIAVQHANIIIAPYSRPNPLLAVVIRHRKVHLMDGSVRQPLR